MTDIKRIKDTAARELQFKDFNQFAIELRDGKFGASHTVRFIDKAIELALASQVEAGITIEQAKDKAAAEYDFPSYGDFHFYYRSGHKKAIEAEGVIKRSYEIYASSAVQTAIEKERERILAALVNIRYNTGESYGDYVVEESEHGEWVKYDDIEKLINNENN